MVQMHGDQTDALDVSVDDDRRFLERALKEGEGSEAAKIERLAAKGMITLDESTADEDAVMEVVIDAGAEDVATDDGVVTVSTPRESFHTVVKALEEAGLATSSAELEYVPTNTVHVTGDEASGLVRVMTQLDDLDDTAFVAANYDIDDDEMAAIQDQLG